jgi:hypothetical protein
MTYRKKLLYSYVVDHDYGDAPNPYFGMCTLVKCKYSKDGRNNLIESIYKAKSSDEYKEIWVVGTGGSDISKSSGNGTILYAMKVDEAITVEEYYDRTEFRFKRPNHNSREIEKFGDNDKQDCGKFALISYDFYYFGNKKFKIPVDLKKQFPDVSLEKENRGFKFRTFTDEFIDYLVSYLRKETFVKGKLGSPCGKKVFQEETTICKSECRTKIKKNANRPSTRRC